MEQVASRHRKWGLHGTPTESPGRNWWSCRSPICLGLFATSHSCPEPQPPLIFLDWNLINKTLNDFDSSSLTERYPFRFQKHSDKTTQIEEDLFIRATIWVFFYWILWKWNPPTQRMNHSQRLENQELNLETENKLRSEWMIHSKVTTWFKVFLIYDDWPLSLVK